MNYYQNATLDLTLLDIIDSFSGDYEPALLHPVEHIDLSDLIREQQLLYMWVIRCETYHCQKESLS